MAPHSLFLYLVSLFLTFKFYFYCLFLRFLCSFYVGLKSHYSVFRQRWLKCFNYDILEIQWNKNLTLSPLSLCNGLFHLRLWSNPLLQTEVSAKNQSQNGKECRSRWGGSLRAISSGSALFAKVYVLVCRHENNKGNNGEKLSTPKGNNFFAMRVYTFLLE